MKRLLALYWFQLFLLVVLCAGDTITTQIAVTKGAIEVNPLAARLLHSQLAFVGVKMGAILLFVYVFERARRRAPHYLTLQIGAMTVLALLYALAIGVNL